MQYVHLFGLQSLCVWDLRVLALRKTYNFETAQWITLLGQC